MEIITNIALIIILKEYISSVLCNISTDEQIVHSYIKQRLHEIPRSLNQNHSISVNVKILLNQLIDLDERQQILTTSIFIEQKWRHPRLSWEELNMKSVKVIRISERKVWSPDTYVHNNADDVMSGFLTGVFVLIHSNGDIQWPVRTQLKTFCPMDITMFPFDLQQCLIEIGSWAYIGHQQILYNASIANNTIEQSADLSSYTDSSDWILISATIQRSRNNGIRLTMTLQRRSFFYIWIFIVPFIMLTILSLMTFCMPSTSNEKLSLSLSVFMAFSMFMIMISEKIPPATKHVPLIGIYLATIMTMTATSIFITVLIINIYQHKGFQRPSYRFRYLFIEKLAPIFKIYHAASIGKNSYSETKFKSSFEKKRNSIKSFDFVSFLRKVVDVGIHMTDGNILPNNIQKEGLLDEPYNIISNKNQNECYLKSIKNNNNKIEWEIIAIVLDNLFFYIFIATYLFIYLTIFLTPFIVKAY